MIRTLKVYTKLGIRYLLRSKIKLTVKTIEIVDDKISNEILSYLKYNNITNDSFNSYFYIILYEIFYLSILLNIKDKKEHKEIINTSIQTIIIYCVIKSVIITPCINIYHSIL